MEENKLIKIENSALQKIGNVISITNKLLAVFNNNLAEKYFDKGLSLYYNKQYEEAILNYDKVIELNHNYLNVYNFRALAKSDLQDYHGAIVDCNKSIENDPNSLLVIAYSIRGGAKYKLQDYKGAIVDYTKVIELDPVNVKAYYSRGLAKNILKDSKGAFLDWSKAGELGDKQAYDLIKKYC